MKSTLGVLLLLALATRPSHALKCYVCSQGGDTPNGGPCADNIGAGTTSTACEQGSLFCSIDKQTAIDGSAAYDRYCARECTAGTVTNGGITSQTTCCTTDNCNGNIAAQPTPMPPPMPTRGGGGDGDGTAAPIKTNPPVVKGTTVPPKKSGFQCYTCTNALDFAGCTARTCDTTMIAGNDRVACQTTKAEHRESTSYSKACATVNTCVSGVTEVDLGGGETSLQTTSCCETSLCNAGSGATSVAVSFAAMAIALAIAAFN